MIAPDETPAASVGAGVLRRNAGPLIAIVVVTCAVEVGVWLAAERALPPVGAAVVALWAALLWTIVAAPVFAAGGRTVLESFARGGVVVDAGIVVLAVLAWRSPALGFWGAVTIYLIWAAIVLAECAVVGTARRPATRHVLAVAVVAVVLVASGSPFWTGPAVMASKGEWRSRAAAASMAANPAFATTAQLSEGHRFRWQEAGVLYDYTVLGRDVLPMPAPPWYATAAIFAGVSLVATFAAAMRRRE